MQTVSMNVPGWALMGAIATAAYLVAGLLAPHIAIGGKSPVEPVTLAILAGLLLRNVGWTPTACEAGVRNYEAALKVGIVLLGLNLTVVDAGRLGVQAMCVIIVCLAITPMMIYGLARRFGIAPKLGILLGVGATICGSTAIAIAAPVIEAKEEEVSYAIGTISLLGVLAMLTLPLVGAAAGLTDAEFGLWAGTAVPATPQVIGAAYMYGDGASAQATLVKMTRNLFMIPAVLFLGAWYAREKASATGRGLGGKQCGKAVPAFLLGFVACVVLRSVIDHFALVPGEVWTPTREYLASATKFLILVPMAGIGLSTRLGVVRRVGASPLLAALVGAALLGSLSYTLIRVFGLGT